MQKNRCIEICDEPHSQSNSSIFRSFRGICLTSRCIITSSSYRVVNLIFLFIGQKRGMNENSREYYSMREGETISGGYRQSDLLPFDVVKKWLIIIPIVIVILGIIREWLLLVYDVQGTSILGLNREQNVGAWYSTVLIFASAFLLMLVGRRASLAKDKDAVHWYILAWVFVALSFDEASSVHEMVMELLQDSLHTSGPLLYAWVIPALILVPAFAIAYIPFLRRLRGPYGAWIFISGAVYVTGALGMEMVGGMVSEEKVAFTVAFLIEESLELAGMTSFFLAILSYLATDPSEDLGNEMNRAAASDQIG